MAPISDDNLKTPKGSDKIIKKNVKKHSEEDLRTMSKASLISLVLELQAKS